MLALMLFSVFLFKRLAVQSGKNRAAAKLNARPNSQASRWHYDLLLLLLLLLLCLIGRDLSMRNKGYHDRP